MIEALEPIFCSQPDRKRIYVDIETRRTKMPAVELADSIHQKPINERYEFSFDVDGSGFDFDRPCLFLFGRQDSMLEYNDAWAALESFSRARSAVLDTAGHSLSWEQGTLFNALASEWLKGVVELS